MLDGTGLTPIAVCTKILEQLYEKAMELITLPVRECANLTLLREKAQAARAAAQVAC